jgi:hypothetical protein
MYNRKKCSGRGARRKTISCETSLIRLIIFVSTTLHRVELPNRQNQTPKSFCKHYEPSSKYQPDRKSKLELVVTMLRSLTKFSPFRLRFKSAVLRVVTSSRVLAENLSSSNGPSGSWRFWARRLQSDDTICCMINVQCFQLFNPHP